MWLFMSPLFGEFIIAIAERLQCQAKELAFNE